MEQGARGKMKKEQRAKRDEKGAVKIGKKERAPKNGREQGEWGKMSEGAGSIDPPPNRAPYIGSFPNRNFEIIRKGGPVPLGEITKQLKGKKNVMPVADIDSYAHNQNQIVPCPSRTFQRRLVCQN